MILPTIFSNLEEWTYRSEFIFLSVSSKYWKFSALLASDLTEHITSSLEGLL